MREALEDLRKDVIEERVSQAVKLSGRGMSMDTIAELVGRSADVALQWVSPVSQT